MMCPTSFIWPNFFENIQGEYFVVGMDIEQYNPSSPQQYLHGVLQNEPDYEVIDAFKSYLSVMASPPTGFENFAIQVI